MNELKKTDLYSYWVNIGYLPRWGVLLLDLFIALIAFIISYLIGDNIVGYDMNTPLPLWAQMGLVLITQCMFFVIFHTYSGILRYSTFVDTMKVSFAVGTTGILLIITNIVVKLALQQEAPFLTSILLIYIFVGITLLFSWRVVIKTVFEYIKKIDNNIDKKIKIKI